MFGQFKTFDKLDLGGWGWWVVQKRRGMDISDWDAVVSISTDSRETETMAFNPNF